MTHSESYIIFLTIATTLIVVLLAIVFLLWRRNRRMVSKVAFLFNAIDNGDYAFRYSEDRKGDAIINQSLNRIKEILQHARDEQIEKEKYFELILDSVDTGVLVVDEERGLVLRCNQAAHKLLNREAITHFNQVSDALKKFSVRETHTILQQRRVRIIAFSDIGGELANQEIDSWVRLIRVLTHEIMNTLTPVISLSEALLPRTEGEQHEGLEVIHRTSKDLIRFVENYRQFTHVPTPQPSPFDVKPFLQRMNSQAKPLLRKDVTITISVEPDDLMVYADEGLIARVVSNLLKNAAEATSEGQHISLHAFSDTDESVIIDVSDDGEPIPPDIASHIFIPFFTTKDEGSGIGLSISRQIMRVSNGSIALLPDRHDGQTTFRLRFQ
jgi:nitrogen fixation/metabolism regulation signal transduction histidine kinase